MNDALFTLLGSTHLALPQVALYCTSAQMGIESLSPTERLLTQSWSSQRIVHFATGRACLRALLQAMGKEESTEILISTNKAPLLPMDFVGTVSHAEGLVGAVLALREQVQSVSLDIELLGAVQRDMWHLLFTAAELAWLQGLAEEEAAVLATALFSMKECFYKLQSPLTGVFLDFPEVEIHWEEARGFVLEVLKDFPERCHLPAQTVLQASIWGKHCVSVALLPRKD